MLSPRQINRFLMIRLPAAFFTGVRVQSISENECETTLKHRWINQNPFRSVFWAVQGMAAELSTGALVMSKIKSSGKSISMLVLENKGKFFKKATGRIIFTCKEGEKIQDAIEEVIRTGTSRTVTVFSEGFDDRGDRVSVFEFEWTLKLRT